MRVRNIGKQACSCDTCVRRTCERTGRQSARALRLAPSACAPPPRAMASGGDAALRDALREATAENAQLRRALREAEEGAAMAVAGSGRLPSAGAPAGAREAPSQAAAAAAAEAVAIDDLRAEMRKAAAGARVLAAEAQLSEANAKLDMMQASLRSARAEVASARTGEAEALAAGAVARAALDSLRGELSRLSAAEKAARREADSVREEAARATAALTSRAAAAQERMLDLAAEKECVQAAFEAALEEDDRTIAELWDRIVSAEVTAEREGSHAQPKRPRRG